MANEMISEDNAFRKHTLLVLAGLLGTTGALAAETTDSTDVNTANMNSTENAWHFILGPEFSATGFRGNGGVGPHSGKLRLPFHKVVEDTQFAFAGGVAATHGPLGLWLSGQYLDLGQDVTSDGGNIRGRAMGHATELNAGVWYEVWTKNSGGQTVHGRPQQLTVAPLAGVRALRLQGWVRAMGESTTLRASWAVPYAGVRVTADLGPRWLLTGEADAGAWAREYTAQGQFAAGYRLSFFDQPATLYAGYQVLHQDFKKHAVHWNVTQYGPVAGLSVTF